MEYTEYNDYARSYRLLKKSENLDRSSTQLALTYKSFAFFYRQIGAWDKSKYYLDMAKEVNPLIELRGNRRNLYNYSGEHQKALEFVQAAYQDKNSARYHVALSYAYWFLGNYDKVVE